MSELRNPKLELPQDLGVTFDRPGLVSEIQPEADALSSALRLVEERAADANRTQHARTTAKAGFEGDYVPVVRILADLAKLGGVLQLPGLAQARRRAWR